MQIDLNVMKSGSIYIYLMSPLKSTPLHFSERDRCNKLCVNEYFRIFKA